MYIFQYVDHFHEILSKIWTHFLNYVLLVWR